MKNQATPPMASRDQEATGQLPRQSVEKKRDLFTDVRIQAEIFARDMGLTRESAERRAAQAYLDQLKTDAASLVERYGVNAEELQSRLETFHAEAPEEVGEALRQMDGLEDQAETALTEVTDQLSGVEERASKKAEPIESVVNANLDRWQKKGYLNRSVVVEGGRVFLDDRLRDLITIAHNERLRLEAFRHPTLEEQESLLLAELELNEHKAEVEHTEQMENVETFLARPLTEVYASMRNGERHPRLLVHSAYLQQMRFASKREHREFDVASLPVRSPESFAKLGMNRKVADLYLELTAHLPSALSSELVVQTQVAAGQLENGYYDIAAESLRSVVRELEKVTEAPLIKLRTLISESLVEVEKQNVDFATESETFSQELYAHLKATQPERTEALDTRAKIERTLRHGRIIDARPIKQVKDGAQETIAIEQAQGNDKVLIVKIAELDESGEEVLDQHGEVKVVKAIAKTSLSENYLRTYVPPDTTTRVEWQSSQEALMFGSDLVPPTVMRSEGPPFGEMSFQLMMQDIDAEGNATRVESVTTIPQWENQLNLETLQDGAILDLLQGVQDGAEWNYLLSTDARSHRRSLHLIDRGLSQPARAGEIVSVLLAIVSGEKSPEHYRKINAKTLKKLKRYESLSEFVQRSLEMSVRFDVGSLAQTKKLWVQSLLRTKTFGDYSKDYKGSWDTLRDKGKFADHYRDGKRSDDSMYLPEEEVSEEDIPTDESQTFITGDL